MDAPTGFCSLCGATAAQEHHLTGRHPDKSYLHPNLTASLCHQHHVLVHNDLRALSIDIPQPGDCDPLRLAAFVLRRLASFLGRYSTYADNPLWGPVATVLEACAAAIIHAINLNRATT